MPEAIRIDSGRRHSTEQVSVVRADADEDTGVRSRELTGAILAFLNAPVTEREPLRIQRLSFTGRDAEELRIELVDVIEKRTSTREHPAGGIWIGVIPCVNIPPAGRHVADGAPALAQQLPKVVGCLDAARQPAAEPDDRDRLVARAVGRLELRRRFVERAQQPKLVLPGGIGGK
jgi:hypothetical protein